MTGCLPMPWFRILFRPNTSRLLSGVLPLTSFNLCTTVSCQHPKKHPKLLTRSVQSFLLASCCGVLGRAWLEALGVAGEGSSSICLALLCFWCCFLGVKFFLPGEILAALPGCGAMQISSGCFFPQRSSWMEIFGWRVFRCILLFALDRNYGSSNTPRGDQRSEPFQGRVLHLIAAVI